TLTLDAAGSLASANLAANAGGTLNLNGAVPGNAAISANGVNGVVTFPGNPGTGAVTRTVGAVSVGSNGLVKINSSAFPGAPAALTVASTSFTDGTSKLDLTNNEVIVSNATLSAVAQQVAAGNITTTAPGGGVGSLQTGPDVELRFTLL